MGMTYGTNAEMDTMCGTPELVSLFTDVLAHRAKAELVEPKGFYHAIAEHAGLTIHFHDDMAPVGYEGLAPPLCVTIWNDAANENVFCGNVDPENLSDCLSCEWLRGDWENKLKQPN